MTSPSIVLIGGGGHAKVVCDALKSLGHAVAAYVDPEPSAWLDALGVAHWPEERLRSDLEGLMLVMGFVGLSCEALERRYAMMQRYAMMKAVFPTIVHPAAVVSSSARIGVGVQIMAGAIVQAGANVQDGAIINSGAVIEHDAVVGEGVHIAPRAVVLGAARVGELSYIGSNAVIIQNKNVRARTLIKALHRYNADAA